jgi:hypothetical protein
MPVRLRPGLLDLCMGTLAGRSFVLLAGGGINNLSFYQISRHGGGELEPELPEQFIAKKNKKRTGLNRTGFMPTAAAALVITTTGGRGQ